MDVAAKVSFAIESVESLLGLESPRDFFTGTIEEDGLIEEVYNGVLDREKRTFYFGKNPGDHALYHEAAHWVLMHNDLLFRDREVFEIFGIALDEVLAEFCANTLDGRIEDHIITDPDKARRNALDAILLKKELELAAGIYLLGHG